MSKKIDRKTTDNSLESTDSHLENTADLKIDENSNESESEFEAQMDAELDQVIGEMFEYRQENNLPEPSEDDINNLVGYYLNIRQAANIFEMYMDSEVTFNIDGDNIQVIHTGTHSCSHCQNDLDEPDNTLN